jgi:hypothetical protein
MEDRMTWNDLVRVFWGPIDDDACEYLLWNATCFPMGPLRQVVKQLRRMFRISGGDVGYALVIADVETMQAMDSGCRNTELEELREDIMSRLSEIT